MEDTIKGHQLSWRKISRNGIYGGSRPPAPTGTTPDDDWWFTWSYQTYSQKVIFLLISGCCCFLLSMFFCISSLIFTFFCKIHHTPECPCILVVFVTIKMTFYWYDLKTNIASVVMDCLSSTDCFDDIKFYSACSSSDSDNACPALFFI